MYLLTTEQGEDIRPSILIANIGFQVVLTLVVYES